MNTLDIISEALMSYGATDIAWHSPYANSEVEELTFKYKGKSHWLSSEDTTAGAYSTAFTWTEQHDIP